MKPNFALSLSFEGIRLMHRSGTGWTIVGDVALDTSDMAGELAMLRKTALALDPAGLRTKLLLPNDQIKYLALDTTRATEDDVKAKLDGATPYAVADLVYDFVRGGGRTYIAAVARETLEEAEAFATEHRFGPVCFAGVPEEFTFVGEAFFGPTKASKTLLPAGETVERDAAPVKVPTKAARPAIAAPAAIPAPIPVQAEVVTPPSVVQNTLPAPVVADPVKVAETSTIAPSPSAQSLAAPILSDTDESISAAPVAPPTPDIVIAAAGVMTKTDAVIPSPGVAPPEPSAAPPPAPEKVEKPASEPVAEPASVPVGDLIDTPVFSSRSRARKDPKATGEGASGQGDALTPPAPASLILTTPVQDATANGTAAAEPAFVRRTPEPTPNLIRATAAPGLATVPVTPVTPPPVTPAPVAVPPGTAQVPKPAEGPPVVKAATGLAVPVGRPASAPPVAGTGRVTIDSVGLVPRGISAAAAKPGAAPPVTGLSGAAPQSVSAPVLAKAVPVGAPIIARKPLVTDAAPLDDIPPVPGLATVARPADPGTKTKSAAAPSWGRPRFLGLILTVILVLVLFAVAAWATMTDTVLSRWLGSAPAEVETAAAVAVPIAIPLSDDPALGTTVAIASAPDAISPEQDAPIQAAPDGLTVAAPARELALPDESTTETATATDPLPADGPENALAELPETDPAAALPIDAAAAAAAAVATAIAGLDASAPEDETIAASPSLAEPVLPEGGPERGTVVTPEEAERFYAATGVWLRAPRLPLLPTAESIDGLYASALSDSSPVRQSAALSPLGADAGLVPQLNPPAPGTRFPRDDRGFILATPEGTLTPDGLLIFAGQPAVLPPTRPGTVAPAVAATDDLPVEAVEAPPLAPGTRPQARPDSIAALAEVAPAAEDEAAVVDPALDDTEAAADPVTAGGVTLASLRPLERPGDLASAASATEVPPVETVAFEGPRPALRPDGLAPEGATSLPETEVAEAETPADPVTEVSAALAAIVDGAADPLAGATPQAVAVARRPDSRPTNFSRVVEQQTARLARAQPATEAPAAASTAGNLSREEQAETEPEVASNAAAAPNGPIPGGVANAATFEDVMALREINLIGVYGQPSQRRALVRLANGRYLRVEVGDSLDGGQVAAISDSALNYVRRGRTITLEIPGE